MTEPKPGDVWRNGDEIRFMVLNDGELTWRELDDYYRFYDDDMQFMDGAVLLFRDGKPVTPQPVGDVVPVEYCVMRRNDDDGNLDYFAVYGQSICSAVDFARSMRPDPHIATVTVNVPKSLLSVPVLPLVDAVVEACDE